MITVLLQRYRSSLDCNNLLLQYLKIVSIFNNLCQSSIIFIEIVVYGKSSNELAKCYTVTDSYVECA